MAANEVEAGRKLPDFVLQASSGGTVKSGDLAGSWTVLYAYPKDDTPGCTIEAKEFTELLPEFKKLGVSVYGISPDSLADHGKFIANCELGLELLSDPTHETLDALGAWGERSMYGRTFLGTLRNTYLIAPDGTIDTVWNKVKAPGHAKDVLQAVRDRKA